jgi:hypothetical protein
MQVQEPSNKLSNLQLELLKLFSRDIPEEQLHDIKNMLARYFAEKASDQFEQIALEKGWNADTYQQWADEHKRTAYSK